MKHLLILCCMLLSGTYTLAQGNMVRDTNHSWKSSRVEGIRSTESISNVSCFDGNLFYSNAGMLFCYSLKGNGLADIDTLFTPIDKSMNYVVKQPRTGIIYYTKREGKRTTMHEIYTTEKGQRKSRQVKLDHYKGSIIHPCFSSDGTIMVFSANNSEGEGGFDLWYSRLNLEGKWMEPVNLGNRINTKGNEFSPAMRGDFLFYSSNCSDSSLLDYDIYVTRLVSSTTIHGDTVSSFPIGLSPIHRIPSPINSNFNEFGIAFPSEGDGAYYVSRSKRDPSDRIFHMDGSMACVKYMGNVQSYENPNQSIPNATITVLSNYEREHVLYTAHADNDGNYYIYLPDESEVKVRTSAINHLSVTEPFDVRVSNNEEFFSRWAYNPILLSFPLHRWLPYQAQTIFGTESGSDITDDGKANMESLVRFYKENGHLKLTVTSVYGRHKSDSYCTLLNRTRLQNILQYLSSQGVNAAHVETRSIVGVYQRTGSDAAEFDNVILFMFE